MTLGDFANLLKDAIGLDAASIGASAIDRAVHARQQACELGDRRVYWDHVRRTETELQALIEAVVVPETWFFRDRESFAELGRFVREEWLPRQPGSTLRLLSLPCATGEEPYSMAMTLLDQGVSANRFRIDAVDISATVLAHGQRGVFGKSSFRGSDLDFRERHFEPTAHGYRIGDAVRHLVTFQRGNLLSRDFLPGTKIYHVIFCRNLLIYFDRAMQRRAIGVLSRLLAPHGLLFVGSSEAGVYMDHDFMPIRVPKVFALRRTGDVPVAAQPLSAAAPPRSSTRRLPEWSARERPVATDTKPGSTMDAPSNPNVELELATRLANLGRLADAARSCEAHIQRHGPSADAFHLLGLLSEARGGQADAITSYRKALYLDPLHEDALIHFALLMERLDRKAEAQVLRTRARRLAQGRGVR